MSVCHFVKTVESRFLTANVFAQTAAAFPTRRTTPLARPPSTMMRRTGAAVRTSAPDDSAAARIRPIIEPLPWIRKPSRPKRCDRMDRSSSTAEASSAGTLSANLVSRSRSRTPASVPPMRLMPSAAGKSRPISPAMSIRAADRVTGPRRFTPTSRRRTGLWLRVMSRCRGRRCPSTATITEGAGSTRETCAPILQRQRNRWPRTPPGKAWKAPVGIAKPW